MAAPFQHSTRKIITREIDFDYLEVLCFFYVSTFVDSYFYAFFMPSAYSECR